MEKIKFKLNGEEREFYGNLMGVAKDFLRENGIISLREGCDGEGVCGLCSIILDGKIANSCILVVGQLSGKEIYTTSYFAGKNTIDKLQEAMLVAGVSQCGYCSPAIYNSFNRLLATKPNPTRDDVKDSLSGTYCRCTGYEQMYNVVEIYKLLMKGEKLPEEKEVKEFRVIEASKCKVDSARLIKGEKSFVEDYVEQDAYFMKILGSPHASAYIKSIDTTEAEKLSGVEYILTYKNAPPINYGRSGQNYPEPSPYDRVLMSQKLHHYGDRVAAVVAKNKWIAEAATKLIKVEYEVLKPVLTVQDAMVEGAPVVHGGAVEYKIGPKIDNSKCDPRETPILYNFPAGGDPRKNLAGSASGEYGDVNKALSEADVVLERKYRTSKVNTAPMETHAVFTKIEEGRLVVIASTQTPWHMRRIISRIIGIPENKIRVIKQKIGGGFGSKQDVTMEEVAAYLTWTTGRSIYSRLTREEQFALSTSRHNADFDLKVAAKKDGTIIGLDIGVLSNTGGYGNNAWTVSKLMYSTPLIMYDIPNLKFDMKVFYTNMTNSGAFRGYGVTQGAFATNVMMREMADKLGMDHIEFVKKNFVQKGKPKLLEAFFNGKTDTDAQTDKSNGLLEAIEKGKKMINWGNKPKPTKDYIKVGQGMAVITQKSGLPHLDSANAQVTLLNDGGFILKFGGTDLGQGLNTAAVQVAAECLKVDMDKISYLASDTDATPYDVGSYASSGTQFSVGAVLRAAKDMRQKLKEAASKELNEPVEDLQLEYPGKIKGKKGEITLAEIGHKSLTGDGSGEVVGFGTFTTHDYVIPYGAHFCEIELNTNTGKVKIKKYYAIQDCGVPINPTLTRGQIYGAVLQSIGYALYEEMIFDETGKLMNPNFLDYKMPKIKEIPEDFKVEFAYTYEDGEEFGPRKSVGEISINGGAPAIANAIFDATGIWMRDLPMSPEKILRGLGKIK
ncbi:MAG: molybdopterin cofactor-binding domain-containing protein [Fusobacteriaceae bacterium]